LGASTKEVGGGSAVGLSNDTISGLRALLNPQLANTGGLGTAGRPDAAGTAGGVFGILSQLLQPGAGNIGGSFAQMLSKQQERDTNALRARFGASGGAAFGTPAAFAETQYRAEAAPQIATQVGQLQLNALQPLLQMAGNLSQLGIAPRQTIQQRGGFADALGAIAPIAGAALPFLLPGVGGPAAAALSAGMQFGPNIAGGGIGNNTQSGGGLYSPTPGYIDPTYQGQGYIR
jgi:hypothetical protein